ncbi:OmpA family protein [Polynucleobacter sp. MWH-P3-07-1]|jgi:outer membrane protein OmpA-like peptidoglycan-associated protein|uniref:flagellar motor protein MotB n=1 Tax=Polynucleobacter sp. MWH-P3-07-1 TaxID=1743173 RepID=UPI001BFDC2D0|nr:flagellar motor protein MotB [Polynucleobacter sp. MWH-P3-07-1]QWD83157.1 OmpA family protein [Polynucleobacter sp. MWH-P3-07-1]
MFNQRSSKKSYKDEGEKPFWISYSDLMTACMTLFLVVMAANIIMIKTKYLPEYEAAAKREQSISDCAKKLQKNANQEFPGKAQIEYNKGDAIRIDLGSIVKFQEKSNEISPEASKFLRQYIPAVLKTVKENQCQDYFRRVIVEGYTSKTGNYMTNLDLSLKRSREVVCELAKNDPDGSGGLSLDEKNQVKRLFLVGGFSFNSQKRSDEESRRAELKLEFWQLGDDKKRQQESTIDLSGKDFGVCPSQTY